MTSPKAGSRARTQQAKESRRKLILEAALDEFYEKGFAASRIEDIASRANLSKASVYLYFPSKEALFHGLVETLAKPKVEELRAIALQSSSLDGLIDNMMGFAPSVIRETRLPKLMKVIAADSQRFPELVQGYREEVIDKIFDVLRAVVERSRESGEIEVEDPELAVRLLVAPVAFSAFWRAVFEAGGESTVDLDSLFRLHALSMKRLLKPSS